MKQDLFVFACRRFTDRSSAICGPAARHRAFIATLSAAFLSLSAALLYAQGVSATSAEVFKHPVNDANRPALQTVYGTLAAKPVVKGRFNQVKHLQKLNRDFTSAGEFLFSGEAGVYWNILKPVASSIVMTKDRMVQRSANGTESVMDGSSNAVFKNFAETIQAVFAGRIQSIEKNFDLYFDQKGKQWTIGLVPREQNVRKVIASMELRGSEFIESLKLVESTGDNVTYNFIDSKTYEALNDNEKNLFR